MWSHEKGTCTSPVPESESFRTPREWKRARTQFVSVEGSVCKDSCTVQRHDNDMLPALDLLLRMIALEEISVAERARLRYCVVGYKRTVVVLPTLGDAAAGFLGFRVESMGFRV